MSNNLPGYDAWKLASPDDEDELPLPPRHINHHPRELRTRQEGGRTIHEADFLYDPIGND